MQNSASTCLENGWNEQNIGKLEKLFIRGASSITRNKQVEWRFIVIYSYKYFLKGFCTGTKHESKGKATPPCLCDACVMPV